MIVFHTHYLLTASESQDSELIQPVDQGENTQGYIPVWF